MAAGENSTQRPLAFVGVFSNKHLISHFNLAAGENPMQ
jgi:hypothetical protein